MHMYALCWCSLCVQLGCDTIDRFTVCLHGWLARERCTWQCQVQVDSTDKSTNAYKIDCHRFLHQTKFLEWMCLWWVECDHCHVHVRLILPWCSMIGYKWSYYIFHVHQNAGKYGFALCIREKGCSLHAFPWSLILSLWWTWHLITRLGRALRSALTFLWFFFWWLLWFMPTMLVHTGESWDETWVCSSVRS